MSHIVSPRRSVLRRTVVGLAAATLLISACSSGDDSGSSADTSPDTAPGSSATETAGNDVSDVTVAPDADPGGVQQSRPVSIDGDPLATFDQDAPEDPVVGEAAPTITGESFDGSPITFGGSSENPTLVVFLAHWCPHCNDEIPQLIELEESGNMPEGLDVIGVSTSVDANAPNFPPSEWVVEKEWPWPIMADDENASAIIAMGGSAFPFAVVLDSDGNVLARRAGGAPAAETQEFLDEALAGASSST